MAVIGLKCNSTPWACSHIDRTSGNLFVGFTPGNFLQLAFPTDAERFPPQKGSETSHFAFALYITSTSGNKGRVGEELPTEQKDTGPTYVTSINGILLPFLLRPKRSGRLTLRPPLIAHYFRLASLSSLVKTHWRG